MAVEVASYIADLTSSNPASSDPVGQGDDHLRLIKGVLQNTFPNFGAQFAQFILCSTGRNVSAAENSSLLYVPEASGATLTHTVSLPAAASIAAGYYLDLVVPGATDVVILDPTGATTIQGSTTFTFGPGAAGRVVYDGSGWRAYQMPVGGANFAVGGTLSVSGAAVLKSTLNVEGATTLSGAVKLNSTLTVSGAAVLQSNLQVGGTFSASGAAVMKTTLNVEGATTLSGNATLKGTLNVEGATTLSGNATLKGTLNVEGATTLSGNATLKGTLNVEGAATISGAAILLSTLHVDGATTLSGAVTMKGSLSISGSVAVAGPLDAARFLSGGVDVATTAWLNFNGTGTPSIRASFNIASITDNGLGDYTANFSATMSTINYAIACPPSGSFNGTYPIFAVNYRFSAGAQVAPTTTAFRIACVSSSGGAQDFEYVQAIVFGGK